MITSIRTRCSARRLGVAAVLTLALGAGIFAAGCSKVPPSLKDTAWPAAFRIQSTEYSPGPSPQEPVISGPNTVDYSFPDVKTNGRTHGRFHSYFQQCPDLPCVPTSFLKLPCHFYLFRDPARKDRYTAYTYSESLKQYVILVDGLGPMYPDFLERYHKVNPVKPQAQPPQSSDLYVDNPSQGGVHWFRVSGFDHYPENDDLFAVYDAPRPPGSKYRPPYSFGGKHMQLVYADHWEVDPDFPPNTFQPPTGYTEVQSPPVPLTIGEVTIDLECPIRFPFDLYDNPVKSGEPLRESVFVCPACHASDEEEDR